MSSASSSSEDETEDGGARGAESLSRRRGSSSASTRRRANGVWPEPFLESLAVRVATDAARSGGRLAAGYALANIFQTGGYAVRAQQQHELFFVSQEWEEQYTVVPRVQDMWFKQPPNDTCLGEVLNSFSMAFK